MLANDNNVARKSISLFWSLFTLQRPYYQLIIFFGLLGFALAFMLGVRLQYPLYDKLIGASFCCGVTIFLVCFIKLLKEL
jgi:hypothetical protein